MSGDDGQGRVSSQSAMSGMALSDAGPELDAMMQRLLESQTLKAMFRGMKEDARLEVLESPELKAKVADMVAAGIQAGMDATYQRALSDSAQQTKAIVAPLVLSALRTAVMNLGSIAAHYQEEPILNMAGSKRRKISVDYGFKFSRLGRTKAGAVLLAELVEGHPGFV